LPAVGGAQTEGVGLVVEAGHIAGDQVGEGEVVGLGAHLYPPRMSRDTRIAELRASSRYTSPSTDTSLPSSRMSSGDGSDVSTARRPRRRGTRAPSKSGGW